MTFNKKHFSEEEKEQEDKAQEEMFTTLMAEPPRPELRMTGIYGDVTEDRCSEAVYGLMALHLTGTEKMLADPEDENSEIIETYQPIDFIISSHGGLAADMFSVYDVIRELRDRTPIHTKGLGKETRAIQRMYVKALAEETSMSEAYVRKLMNKKTNVYLDAEEAVKLGIADIIF